MQIKKHDSLIKYCYSHIACYRVDDMRAHGGTNYASAGKPVLTHFTASDPERSENGAHSVSDRMGTVTVFYPQFLLRILL